MKQFKVKAASKVAVGNHACTESGCEARFGGYQPLAEHLIAAHYDNYINAKSLPSTRSNPDIKALIKAEMVFHLARNYDCSKLFSMSYKMYTNGIEYDNALAKAIGMQKIDCLQEIFRNVTESMPVPQDPYTCTAHKTIIEHIGDRMKANDLKANMYFYSADWPTKICHKSKCIES